MAVALDIGSSGSVRRPAGSGPACCILPTGCNQSVQTMLARLPALLFCPILWLWCLVYGVPGGVFFKLAAVYENWVATNRYHYILWKKYPQRSYQKYISSLWASEIKGLPMELAEYTRQKIEQNHLSEPFPFLRLLTNSIFMLFILPYMVATGIIKGPLFVYRREMQARQQYFSQRGLPT
jgi:hypothetical protein